ncbi:hypothetical protein Trydic_g12853, partial [Trypoxylus dichotomus]
DSPVEIGRQRCHSEGSAEESSAQVASQPDDDLQRRPSPHVLRGCRPISLVCTISKVSETLLLAGISDHLDYHRLLDMTTSDSDTATQSLHSPSGLRIMSQQPLTENRWPSWCLWKAFDKIRHQGLLLEMKNCGFTARILKTVGIYLQNRSFNTAMNGTGSTAKSMKSDHRVFNAIYADYTAIVATSRHSKIAAEFAQAYLAKIEEFFCIWGLKIGLI